MGAVRMVGRGPLHTHRGCREQLRRERPHRSLLRAPGQDEPMPNGPEPSSRYFLTCFCSRCVGTTAPYTLPAASAATPSAAVIGSTFGVGSGPASPSRCYAECRIHREPTP